MKVLQLIARVNRGGTATWLENLVVGLRENNIEVLIAAGYCPQNELEDSSFEKLGGRRIENLGRNLSAFSDIRAFFEIRKLIKEFKPDLINTHTAKAGALGRLANFTLLGNKSKIIHTYHGHVLTGYFNFLVSNIFKNIERFLSKCTDLYIVSGQKVKEDLLKMGIGEEKKYRIINPGIKTLIKYNSYDLKTKYNIDHSKFCIGWMGRLTSIKRPEIFLELAIEFPQFQFIIAGEGELKNKLEKDAPQNVRFLGWVDTAEFWSLCDLGVLTSENEGKPMSLVEAAQLGVPIIADNVGAVNEVILDKVSGLLSNNMSERIINLRLLSENNVLRTEMSKTAMQYARKNFSLEEFLNSHIKIYNELL